MQNVVKQCVNDSDGKYFVDYNDSIEFTSENLFYSVQYADYSISGLKDEAVFWTITTTLTDRYDFDKIRKGFTKGDMANNLGYFMQLTSMLHAYRWDITYYRTYIDE